jgi:uncharacterized protein YdeI (YjbR/CyaY-like superfamily)
MVRLASASEFRHWLAARHSTASELWVTFHKKASGKGGMTYAEALDEALCFGWIDGVRRGVDRESYTIRFTPRKPRSTWSRVNVRHAERLIADGRMQEAGLKAFESREERRTGIYSFEQRPRRLPDPLERLFKADKRGWAFWQKQPPGYRRTAIWWVVSAVREDTRLRRLGRLITISRGGGRLGLLI